MGYSRSGELCYGSIVWVMLRQERCVSSSRVVVRQARYVSFWCVMAGELGYVSSRFVWL